jgi:hypothetical protein
MAQPITRTEFKEYCLRRLGKPVIDINVEDTQLEDRIDDAIDFFQEYHFDGVERVIMSHQLTQDDVDTRNIQWIKRLGPTGGGSRDWGGAAPYDEDHPSDRIVGVTRLLYSGKSGSSMFNLDYQLRFNDVTGTFRGGTTEMSSYWMRMSNLAMVEDMLDPQPNIRFNRLTNKLFVDWDWNSDAVVGEYIIFEAYRAVDPETWYEMWSSPLFRDYCTALFKEQWGLNLSKYEGVQLPGGTTLNGRAILEDAKAEIAQIKETMSLQYELPVDFYAG